MYKILQLALLACLELMALVPSSAQCIPSLCGVAITIQSNSSGIVITGSGTNSATVAFGSMQAFGGTKPTGVTKTVTGTNWTVTTPFDVTVTCTVLLTLLPCANALSPSYTLTAQLQGADAINTWKIGVSIITSAVTTTLTSSGTFAAAIAYTFALTIPFSESAGAISNRINLVATAN